MKNFFFDGDEDERPDLEPTGRVEHGGPDMINEFMDTTADMFAGMMSDPVRVPAAAIVWLSIEGEGDEIAAHCQAVSYNPESLGVLGYLGGTLLAKHTVERVQNEAGVYFDDDFDLEEDDDDDE